MYKFKFDQIQVFFFNYQNVPYVEKDKILNPSLKIYGGNMDINIEDSDSMCWICSEFYFLVYR